SVSVQDAAAVWARWDEQRYRRLADPECRAAARLVDTTLRALPQILLGTTAATQVMFPAGSMELVESLYKHNPVADLFNDILAAQVVAFVEEHCRRDPALRLRILEIGAGTGGTSGALLARLKPYERNVVEYCYTDLSRAFLRHAEQTYGPNHPNLRYRLFDVEKSPVRQGLELGGYDLVIAANVLHATRDIRRTLRHASALLRRNGLLVLNEMSRNSLFAHLTFGLLEGWWLYEDSASRLPGGPALGPEQWQTVLTEEGFRSVSFPAKDTHRFCQQIVVAERDETILSPIAERHSFPSPPPAADEPYETLAVEEKWEEAALAADVARPLKTIVCFLSAAENRQSVAAAITARHADARILFVGQKGGDAADGFHLVRGDRHAYAEVLRRIREEYGPLEAVLYFWGLEDPTCVRDLAPIVYLIQGIAVSGVKPAHILLAGPWSDADRYWVESWIGFERTMGMVLPDTALVSLYREGSSPIGPDVMGDWALAACAELCGAKPQTAFYRDGRRHVQRIQPTKLEQAESLLKTGGVYLITGGMGGIAFALARHLRAQWNAKLILTGRSSLDEGLRGKLASLGVDDAIYVEADVTDASRMREAIGLGKKRFGRLDGVIHAAGIEGSGSLLDNDMSVFNSIVNPKIAGTCSLDEALGDEILDFICYFTSPSALLGDFGSCAYAVGNRFQMAYAEARPRHLGKAVAIGWPYWKEGGMGQSAKDRVEFYLRSSGQHVLKSEDGVLLFERLLAQPRTQHIVFIGQPSRVHRFLGLSSEMVGQSPKVAVEAGPGRHAGTTGLSIAQCVEWELKEQASRLLDIPREDFMADENLANFGFDSILLSQYAVALGQQWQIELTPSVFFGYPTIEKLTAYFLAEHGAVIDAFYREETDVASAAVSPDIPVAAGPGLHAGTAGLSVIQCVEWELKEQASRLLDIPREDILVDENLANFGFDSILLSQYAVALVRQWQIELTPSVFFGYPTIEKLTAYFLAEHRAVMDAYYRAGTGPTPPAALSSATAPARLPAPSVRMSARFDAANSVAAIGPVLPARGSSHIAIIGMSGRFPKSRNVEEMWAILAEGRDAVGPAPADRRGGWAGVVYQAGFMPGVDEFEPLFFEISPREAEAMDPRQRLLLQEAWKALEDAGYGPTRLKAGKAGMFVGVEDGEYALLGTAEGNITSNHSGIVAARLAYVLNFDGPTMALNTACSSGLVAVHQACQSLRTGECDIAVAAGVNMLVTPNACRLMDEAGMLSKDNRCFTFDERANGMVPAEAVAVVVLKRLSQAEADGDPIHAVIAGSGINYDGRTNGITAPSGVSQAALLKSVYDTYGIDPGAIDYVVAHGTGTALGDPIEVNALTEAFKAYTNKTGYCALTSTKSNFGHGLASSGVVSLIALVQALRHQTIPASLHCERESSHILWANSPFIVNKANKPWPRKMAGKRVGTVSAFGMSGTNAHIVVQGYDRETAAVPARAPCYLLALSARTEAALAERIADLAAVLEREDAPDLARVSYTLLDGRHHLAHRCAVVVRGRDDALHLLRQAGGKERLPNLFRGTVARQFAPQTALQGYGQTLLAQARPLRGDAQKYKDALHALADLYCQGYEFDWAALYGAEPPQRINLPTYPFARERYWVAEGAAAVPGVSLAQIPQTFLHPLLHRNTSDLSEQRFTSVLTGAEFFLAEHVVRGSRVLPGVAHLEMARAAVAAALGVADGVGIHLDNVVLVRPLVVEDKPLEVRIGLYPAENGAIAYEIYRNTDGETSVWSQGTAAVMPQTAAPVVDLPAWRARCTARHILPERLYAKFRTLGLELGPSFRGMAEAWAGVDEAVARAVLPDGMADGAAAFLLHPSVMDSALQGVCAALLLGDGNNLALPFAIEGVEIFGSYSGSMWAVARRSAGCRAEHSVQRLDIDLCDADGRVRVRLTGFSARAVGATAIAELDRVVLAPVWRVGAAARGAGVLPGEGRHVVLLCEVGGDASELAAHLAGARCIEVAASGDVAERYGVYAERLLTELQ
ncbi:MAG TPA: SDR family NAD(P)-dependent oxidoreductase, partial [Bradyrhizobium sp.]|nr:SDR family NAD(P)-dependent oxidoreductase [Bradyrhizobium sp.]